MSAKSRFIESLPLPRRREDGQTTAEYGVVLAVITVATVGILTALAGGITNTLNAVIDVLTGS